MEIKPNRCGVSYGQVWYSSKYDCLAVQIKSCTYVRTKLKLPLVILFRPDPAFCGSPHGWSVRGFSNERDANRNGFSKLEGKVNHTDLAWDFWKQKYPGQNAIEKFKEYK